MLIRKNTYYDKFSCIAGKCPDICCHEWDVQIDPETAEKYRALPGNLGDRLRQFRKDDPEAGTILENQDGRCPMWRQDGLCQIQSELGHDALCKVCREFPRLTHDYGDFMELGLELSCPEAARLILTSPSAPMIEVQSDSGEDGDYDREAMAILLETRKYAIKILENKAYSLPQALTLLVYYGYQAQGLLDGEDLPAFIPEDILTAAKEFSATADIHDFLAFFSDLEILNPAWAHRLSAPSPTPWSDCYRNLARYFIERYWLQAISDYDLVCRVKFAVISCLLIHLLGGNFLTTAQSFSKEIENNIDNVDAILDGAYTVSAFTDRNLLGLLQI